MIKTYYNDTEELLSLYIDEESTLEDLAEVSNNFHINDEISGTLRIMEFIDTKFARFSVNDLQMLLKSFLRANSAKISNIRHAVITNDPSVVANLMLLQKKINDIKYSIQIFSTEEAAKDWLFVSNTYKLS